MSEDDENRVSQYSLYLTDGEMMELEHAQHHETKRLVADAKARVLARIEADHAQQTAKYHAAVKAKQQRLRAVIEALNTFRASVAALRMGDLEAQHIRLLVDAVVAADAVDPDAWDFGPYLPPEDE